MKQSAASYLDTMLLLLYMKSNARNDVPRVAQRYGAMAAHIRHRASVLVVLVVFLHAHVQFAGLIRRVPPSTFSDTITDRHSHTTVFQLRAHCVRISWFTGSEKSFGHVPPVGVETSTSHSPAIKTELAPPYIYINTTLLKLG